MQITQPRQIFALSQVQHDLISEETRRAKSEEYTKSAGFYTQSCLSAL